MDGRSQSSGGTPMGENFGPSPGAILNSGFIDEIRAASTTFASDSLLYGPAIDKSKLSLTSQLTKTVSNMVLDFVQITSCLHELEKKFVAE